MIMEWYTVNDKHVGLQAQISLVHIRIFPQINSPRDNCNECEEILMKECCRYMRIYQHWV